MFCSDAEQLSRPTDMKIKRCVKAIRTKNSYIYMEYFQDRQKYGKYECGYNDKGFAM